MKKILILIATVCLIFTISACGGSARPTVVIYTSAEDNRIAAMQADLDSQFPNYEIIIEYFSTGELLTKLNDEGTQTNGDIIGEMEYANLARISDMLADLSGYNTDIYTDDMIPEVQRWLPWYRNGGCIAINRTVISDKNLPIPESYEDLLKPEYKGLISMPNPQSSGTGYMFLKSLVNAWGEQEAFDYFTKLSENILGFTSSGSGPVNALIEGEVAIGFAMTAQTVGEINNGFPLRILFFEEGSPFSLYGLSLIEGREKRKEVKEVFDYIVNRWTEMDKVLFCPERIYKDREFTLPNYPSNIRYADMSNNATEEKGRLLEIWKLAVYNAE
ncbi:MAG: extracellular solute-binding protein [Oscillospiraceae bacterium]|nr:extracellular solute-binding protein [Oscillospiraceae bacterium]